MFILTISSYIQGARVGHGDLVGDQVIVRDQEEAGWGCGLVIGTAVFITI